MIIDKDKFATKAELIKYLVDNQKDIVQLKKAAIKRCDPSMFQIKTGEAGKAAAASVDGILEKTIVGNTYNWLDSHDDVHIDGLFSKSINENKSRILFLHDHENKVSARIGKFSDVYEQRTDWKTLGVDIEGKTTCLMADARIMKELNAGVYTLYKDGEINQHSVGMQYIQLAFCVNSAEEYYKEYLANWNKFIDKIGNQEKAIDNGYFWAITEAKLIEISAVNFASNELTPTLNDKQAGLPLAKADIIEAGISTSEEKFLNPNLI